MPALQRPTVRLHYDEVGSGDQSIIFLHGWCDSSASWASTIAAFRARFRCIVPDMRGHGQSGMPGDHAFSAEALSNDIVALCESLGIERPVLVGHSYGGYLAGEVARRFPRFARALVIEDQPLDIRTFASDMRRLESTIRTDETHMAFRTGMFASMVTDAMPSNERIELERISNETPVDVALALWAGLFEFTPEELEERAIALMRGLANQPSLSIEAQPQQAYHTVLAEFAPGANTTVIPSGHWIHLEHPNEFQESVERFLSTLD